MLGTTLTRSVLRTARTAVPAGVRAKHTLPDLPYDFGALEPFISAEIMEVHHNKHHNTYVTNLNVAEEKLQDAVAKNDIASTLALQGALKFNGGGHINHSLFWKNLAPAGKGGGELPEGGPLSKAISKDFGSLDQLQGKFNAALAGIQGSGWGWLGYNKASGELEIVTTANQDPLLTHVPLVGIDAWEHAYYLQYKNVKADYFKAIWYVFPMKLVEAKFADWSTGMWSTGRRLRLALLPPELHSPARRPTFRGETMLTRASMPPSLHPHDNVPFHSSHDSEWQETERNLVRADIN